MDKILITYRGGIGDVYSVLAYFNKLKNHKITILIEKQHFFLQSIFKDVVFIINPIENIFSKYNNVFSISLENQAKIIESEKINQKLYDNSIIDFSFYQISKIKEYRDFYKKLIDQNDLIIINYLDLTAIDVLNESKKEWWQIRSWNKWPDFKYIKLLNQKSPYKNFYYYKKEWLSDELIDENGIYEYEDTVFLYKMIDETKEKQILNLKREKNKQIFFITLGSMSNHNLKIGKHVKFSVIKEIKKLFEKGWVGITTKNEYNTFLRNIKNEKFIHLIDQLYPHDIVFENIDLFLTHGGAGSFARAMNHNIKTYVFPFQLDQFYFGKILKNLHKGKMIT